MFQWLTPPFRLNQDKSFLPKREQQWNQNVPYLWYFWKEENQQWNQMLWWGVNVRRAGGCQGPGCLGRLTNYLGTTHTFPPSSISASTQNNSLFANQNIGGRVAIMTYWTMQLLYGHFPSAFWALPGSERRLHWIPDTTKKQRIPFDVSHNFVLPTIMKYNVFGGRGPKD